MIRNSDAEFPVFAYQSGGDGVEVRVQHSNLWLSQKNIAALFDTYTDNVGLHLKNISAQGKLHDGATAEEFSVVQPEGARQAERTLTQPGPIASSPAPTEERRPCLCQVPSLCRKVISQ